MGSGDVVLDSHIEVRDFALAFWIYKVKSSWRRRAGLSDSIRVFLRVVVFLSLSGPALANGWQEALDRVAPGVVELRVTMPRPFDDLRPGSQTATGFVVDAERGLILTNRHVVTSGPVVAEAVFLDNEEVDLQAVYRDPVHDFGFYRFDPSAVKFMEPFELQLAPERARVGAEVRVIGNDAGEKLSILAGTLARMDRAAPVYGRSGYNDFNTFYYQAASGTSGGSSGSPVIDETGKVIALNAGGKRFAASSFYLPLDRVVRALQKIQAGEPVSRGTIQAILVHRSFDELKRLGLPDRTEAEVRARFPEGTGMLVVGEVLPEGPAHGALEPGDIFVRIDGELVNSFLPVEAVLDERVGQSVQIEVERQGTMETLEVPVQDLHAVSPASYLQAGGAVFNPLSYQQARNYGVPIRGVYVAGQGYMLSRAGVPRGAILTELDGQPIDDLQSFEKILAAIPEGQKTTLRYFNLSNPRSAKVATIESSRSLFSMELCSRDDATGRWPCRSSAPALPASPRVPATTSMLSRERGPAKVLSSSLALVRYDLPYLVDGVHAKSFVGIGLVVDAEKGLVLVDRETVPVPMGDLQLTFGSSVEIPGEIVYLHPEHNFSVIAYDPVLLGQTAVHSAELRPEVITVGDEVWLVGLTPTGNLVSRRTQVAGREPLRLSLPRPPRFRDRNIELITVEDAVPTLGGVLADADGNAVALWASFSDGSGKGGKSFFAGIPVEHFVGILDALKNGKSVGWRTLGVEFVPLSLAVARNRGLSDARAKTLEAHDSERRRVLGVERITSGGPASTRLREGDLVLEINGSTVTRFREVEIAAQEDLVDLLVLRDGEEIQVQVATELLDGRGTERTVLWAGTLLQAPHRALAEQRGLPQEGVYVARSWFGSPADRYGLGATDRIVALDGRPTPDLDHFLAAAANQKDRGPVRLKVVNLDGKTEVITLRLDLEYWPTYSLALEGEGWQRTRLSAAPAR